MVFIFIGRGGRTPFKSGYKWTPNYRSNSTRITQDQTGQTGRPDRSDRSASAFANFGCQQCHQQASIVWRNSHIAWGWLPSNIKGEYGSIAVAKLWEDQLFGHSKESLLHLIRAVSFIILKNILCICPCHHHFNQLPRCPSVLILIMSLNNVTYTCMYQLSRCSLKKHK